MSESIDTTRYTAAQIIAAIGEALKAHDMPAVAGLMRLLAVRDPEAAQAMLDMVRIASLMHESEEDHAV